MRSDDQLKVRQKFYYHPSDARDLKYRCMARNFTFPSCERLTAYPCRLPKLSIVRVPCPSSRCIQKEKEKEFGRIRIYEGVRRIDRRKREPRSHVTRRNYSLAGFRRPVHLDTAEYTYLKWKYFLDNDEYAFLE